MKNPWGGSRSIGSCNQQVPQLRGRNDIARQRIRRAGIRPFATTLAQALSPSLNPSDDNALSRTPHWSGGHGGSPSGGYRYLSGRPRPTRALP
ncbi:hypothetical protein WR25_17463 [Diploscapter pachys]|uniref:Uncharacterized protein n=1 Tax=Diploscapter pachys TaxID=2018661 RepID=A0A2A2M1T3_9BILA|nr:hypothetical protein WR25_17463 [Diploscapter pachys]